MPYSGPCYWKKLRVITTSVTKRYEDALKPYGIAINQYCILSNINKMNTPSTSALANAIELDRTTLVRTLAPLEKRGLIRDTSSLKSRDRALELTEEGKALLEKARTSWQSVQTDVEQLFGAENIAAIESMITILHDE